jgi:hypothetical protein
MANDNPEREEFPSKNGEVGLDESPEKLQVVIMDNTLGLGFKAMTTPRLISSWSGMPVSEDT